MKRHSKVNVAVLNQKHDVEFYLFMNLTMGLSATLMMTL